LKQAELLKDRKINGIIRTNKDVEIVDAKERVVELDATYIWKVMDGEFPVNNSCMINRTADGTIFSIHVTTSDVTDRTNSNMSISIRRGDYDSEGESKKVSTNDPVKIETSITGDTALRNVPFITDTEETKYANRLVVSHVKVMKREDKRSSLLERIVFDPTTKSLTSRELRLASSQGGDNFFRYSIDGKMVADNSTSEKLYREDVEFRK